MTAKMMIGDHLISFVQFSFQFRLADMQRATLLTNSPEWFSLLNLSLQRFSEAHYQAGK